MHAISHSLLTSITIQHTPPRNAAAATWHPLHPMGEFQPLAASLGQGNICFRILGPAQALELAQVRISLVWFEAGKVLGFLMHSTPQSFPNLPSPCPSPLLSNPLNQFTSASGHLQTAGMQTGLPTACSDSQAMLNDCCLL